MSSGPRRQVEAILDIALGRESRAASPLVGQRDTQGPSAGQAVAIQVSAKKVSSQPLTPVAAGRSARVPPAPAVPAVTAQAGRMSSPVAANARSPLRAQIAAQGGVPMRPVLGSGSARVITSSRRTEDSPAGISMVSSRSEELFQGGSARAAVAVLVGSTSAPLGPPDCPPEGLVRAAAAQRVPAFPLSTGYIPQPILPAKQAGQPARTVMVQRMQSGPRLGVAPTSPITMSPGPSTAASLSGRGLTGAILPMSGPPTTAIPGPPLARSNSWIHARRSSPI